RMTYFMPASAHHDREIARCGERRLIEPAKRQVGSYVQLQLVPGEHLVAHAYGVVIVRHHDGFLEHASFVLEPPDRDAIVHPKLRQVAMRFAYHPFVRELGSAEMQPMLADDEHLVEPRDHDVPAFGCAQVRDE